MPSETKKNPSEPSRPNRNVFSKFQSAVISLVETVPNAALKAIGNDPDAALVKSNALMVQNMFKNGFAKINAELKSANKSAVDEAMEFLEATDAVAFIQLTEKTALNSFSNKIFGGNIWQWLGQNMTEIKKIIGMILGFISKKLEAWWKKFEPIIDQFWDLFWSLLSGMLGFNRREIARDLSQAHVNYLNEMTAHARLMQAVNGGDDFDDD